MRIALSIAGSDPSGGAGLQADLQVFRAHGVHGAGLLTALTIQDSRKVRKVLPVFPSLVLDQLRVLLADFQPAAVKIGMLASDDVLRAVALGLETLAPGVPVVIDPVLAASDGTPLLERRAWPALRALFSGRTLVTPNLVEAAWLTDCETDSRRGCEAAARVLVSELGAEAALIKGGHRSGAPDDLLALRGEAEVELHWLAGEHIETEPVHGTGCALSSAIAARLALDHTLPDAVAGARAFVAAAIRAAEPPGAGCAPFLVLPDAARV
jgi:hydroxymethylpyrimidine/phosphomethylpyrimidine kinase